MKKLKIDSVPLIEAYLTQHFVFRANVVLGRAEFRRLEDEDFELLTERDINSIFRQLHHASIGGTVTTLNYVLNSDYVPRYNPIIEYFESLAIWHNGETDHINQLANTVDTTDNQRWRTFFRKWIVAVVACALEQGTVNHQVLVFVGPQGIGKSRWQHRLVPKRLQEYVYAGDVNPTNKDAMMHLCETVFIILDELDTINKGHLSGLKSIITQSTIRVRKVWGMFNEHFIRRASFMGSVNDIDFLTDSTGNRRFLSFLCTAINYNHDVNMDDVFSQAYALYKAGFRFWFEGDDIVEIEATNESFMRVSVEEESLLNYFSKPQMPSDVRLMTTTDIGFHLEERLKADFTSPAAIRRLGQALAKHGFERISMKSSKPYKVKLVI